LSRCVKQSVSSIEVSAKPSPMELRPLIDCLIDTGTYCTCNSESRGRGLGSRAQSSVVTPGATPRDH
jgi:hypothetical protein